MYRNFIDKLKRQGKIDEEINELVSPDWHAEQELLPDLLHSLALNEQWIPRNGEIVLFLSKLSPTVDVSRHDETKEFRLYDDDKDEFLGSPPWQAGLVAQVPTKPSSIEDLHQSDSKISVIYSGVRVEPLPDPNGEDKSSSKQYKQVALRQTRPFVLWKELLHNVPQDKWHPTIINALTIMSTVSLVGKLRFRGTWPEANIFCHGMYIGSEMVAIGDTVRLTPSSFKMQTKCQDILMIKSIRVKLSNMDKASSNDWDGGRPYNSEIWIYGAAYTSDASQLNKEYLSEENAEPPRAAKDYGEWYPVHPTTKELAVPYGRVLGRLYEREAMTFWLTSSEDDPPDGGQWTKSC